MRNHSRHLKKLKHVFSKGLAFALAFSLMSPTFALAAETAENLGDSIPVYEQDDPDADAAASPSDAVSTETSVEKDSDAETASSSDALYDEDGFLLDGEITDDMKAGAVELEGEIIPAEGISVTSPKLMAVVDPPEGSIAAVHDHFFDNMEDAVDAAIADEDDGPLRLLDDYEGQILIPEGGDGFILDLNGHRVYYYSETSGEEESAILIAEGGVLTIRDNTESGEVDGNKCAVFNRGTLTIESGRFSNKVRNKGGNMTILDGQFYEKVSNQYNGTMTISNGLFDIVSNEGSENATGTVSIAGGLFNKVLSKSVGGSITIDGGDIRYIHFDGDDRKGDIIVNGGLVGGEIYLEKGTGVLLIYGGDFTGIANITLESDGYMEVSGGIWGDYHRGDWLADGYQFVDQGNGTYVVEQTTGQTSFSVTFSVDGDTGVFAPVTVTNGSTYFSAAGWPDYLVGDNDTYYFWYTDPDDNSTRIKRDMTVSLTENITLYGKPASKTWVSVNNNGVLSWYWFNDKARPVTYSWKAINGRLYFFGQDGVLQTSGSGIPGGQPVDPDNGWYVDSYGQPAFENYIHESLTPINQIRVTLADPSMPYCSVNIAAEGLIVVEKAYFDRNDGNYIHFKAFVQDGYYVPDTAEVYVTNNGQSYYKGSSDVLGFDVDFKYGAVQEKHWVTFDIDGDRSLVQPLEVYNGTRYFKAQGWPSDIINDRFYVWYTDPSDEDTEITSSTKANLSGDITLYGKPLKSKWLNIPRNGVPNWYFFNDKGNMMKNRWKTINGCHYSFNEDGVMETGTAIGGQPLLNDSSSNSYGAYVVSPGSSETVSGNLEGNIVLNDITALQVSTDDYGIVTVHSQEAGSYPNESYRAYNADGDEVIIMRLFARDGYRFNGNIAVTYENDGQVYNCYADNDLYTRIEFTVANAAPAAPSITSQPQSVTANAGETVSFSVGATGEGLNYQWYYSSNGGASWGKTTVSGAKTNTITMQATTARNGNQYRCEVTGSGGGKVTSDAATLAVSTVPAVPSITSQPQNVTANAGETVSFSVGASGEGLTYQWYYSSNGGASWGKTTVSGAKTNTITMQATTARNGNRYRCEVTGSGGGKVISDAATLAVSTVPAGPSITSQPQSVTAAAGETVSFSVGATGEGLNYQWYYSSNGGASWGKTTVSGAKTATITMQATTARNGNRYRCEVTGTGGGKVTSDAATLTVGTAPAVPSITSQPQSVTAAAGETVSFSVGASGEGLTYQWYYSSNGGASWGKTTVSGAKTDTITMQATTARNGNRYRCEVTGSGGKVTSDDATLTVGTAPAVPAITRQPQSVTAAAGETVSFSVGATGEGLSYQWYYSSNGGASWGKTTVSGAKTATITMQATTARNGNRYRCEVTGSGGGKATSDAAQLTVTQ